MIVTVDTEYSTKVTNGPGYSDMESIAILVWDHVWSKFIKDDRERAFLDYFENLENEHAKRQGATQEPIEFLYTNYKGETAMRRAVPISVKWSNGNEWHPSPGWEMVAWCKDRNEVRFFRLADIDFNAKLPLGQDEVAAPEIEYSGPTDAEPKQYLDFATPMFNSIPVVDVLNIASLALNRLSMRDVAEVFYEAGVKLDINFVQKEPEA